MSDVLSVSDEELDDVTSWSAVEGGCRGRDGGRGRGGGVGDRGGK